MNRTSEEISARYGRWDLRLRGWQTYPEPVVPEPPFVPFPGHDFSGCDLADDGRRATALSRLFGSLWMKPTSPPTAEKIEEPIPIPFFREELRELPLFLSPTFDVRDPEFEAFIVSLNRCFAPLAFELIGAQEHVTAQLAVGAEDESYVRQQLRAFFPDLVTAPAANMLEAALVAEEGHYAVVDFALSRDCLYPLATIRHDLCVPLVGTLSELRPNEVALYQVLFQATREPWAENIIRSVTDGSGKAFFVNSPELAGAANSKIARPLFAAVVRVAVRTPDYDRTWQIARQLAGALNAFANPTGNELIPLGNDDYPLETHVEDVVRRQTHRSGMLLNADEFLGFVRFPTSAVRSSKLRRQTAKTKAAPAIASEPRGLLLGVNEHAGETHEVRLLPEQRLRHTHIIGASGTGKTTLLYNLIVQDIAAGEGLGVLDPHGDLIDRILGVIPENRIDDVVLLDAADEEFSVGFNILSAHSDMEKNLLASDLVSVFQRLSTSWGDQMGIVLNNAVRAFLESDQGGTIADLRRFLLEPPYREQFLKTVHDPDIVYFWRKGFTQLAGNKSIGPVLTRLETFLSPKPVRYVVSQVKNRLDFAHIMDSGKIFLAKLSQGAIGKENSYLLGSLLMAKIQQVAMGRQRQEESARRNFWLYLDEFHNFITPSTAEILTGARKYHIGLALAHHELRQLQRDSDVASAVVTNSYTRIYFRVGDQDARPLANGLSSFDARDLQNLGTGEAVCRVERSDFDFNLAIPRPQYPDEAQAKDRRLKVIAASREKYATPRASVERTLLERMDVDSSMPSSTPERKQSAGRDLGHLASQSTNESPPSAAQEQAKLTGSPATPANELLTSPVDQSPPTPNPVPNKPISPQGDLGRGGTQHKAIQKRLKEAAEQLGFRATIEHATLDGAGSVDVLIARGDYCIACEITITTTIDHEVGNVSKCVKAGFEHVALVAITADRLARLHGAVTNSLGAEIAARVQYFLPDQFIAHLRELPSPPPPPPAVKEIRGYKIRTTYSNLSPEETKAREDAAIQTIADLMSRKH